MKIYAEGTWSRYCSGWGQIYYANFSMAQEPSWNRKPDPLEPFFSGTGSGTGTVETVFRN